MMLCVISYWVLSGAKRRQIQQLRCCVLPAKLLKRRDVYLKLTRHKKLLELASDAGAIYRFDSTVLINREIFDAYLERFHEPARKITVEEVEDE